MKSELTTLAGLLLMPLLALGAAGAPEQVITPAPLQRVATPGQPVAFTVGYTTANPCSDHLTGLGLRIHWDSRRLAFVSLTGALPAALVAQGPAEDDSADADADPATDKFVQVAWADLDGAWPGGGCTTVNLYTANFNSLAGLTGPTPIRFSASSTAAGYALSAVPATVTLPSYPITASASPPAGGTLTCNPNPVSRGSSSTCTAAPNTGYTLSTFTGCTRIGTTSQCTLTGVTAAKTLTATFSTAKYPITATANPAAGGTVICAPNPVTHGANSTCSAVPATGYAFTGFTGGCTGATCNLTNVTAPQGVTANFSLKTYAITTSASPLAAGTLTCIPNPVAHGTDSTCTATPNTGFALSTFTGCTRIGTTSQCTLINVTGAKSVTATFSTAKYPITATASPPVGGTLTCTPNPVTHGSGSTCTAAARTGYTLGGFTGCTRIGTTSRCSLTQVTAPTGVTANFSLKTYAIATGVSPLAGGTLTCTPSPVTHGTNSTCTATPNTGFALSTFTGCTRIGTTSQCTLISVTGAKSVTATFSTARYPITATASPPVGGTLTCTPNPVSHGSGGTCTAAARTGYTLGGFTGCTRIGTTSQCSLTQVTAPTGVTATFVVKTYPLTAVASPVLGGSVSCDPNPVAHGGGGICTATPNTGYTLSAFTGCTRIGATSQCTLTSVIAAKTVVATFSLAKYPITAAASPPAGGTLTCTPNPVSHGSGSTCTAAAKTGYILGGFTGCTRIGTTSQCSLTQVTAPTGVTATFVLKIYPITGIANPLAGGSVSCDPNPVTHGGGSICNAAATIGYTFSGFIGCTRSGTTSQCTLSKVTAAKTVTAAFRR